MTDQPDVQQVQTASRDSSTVVDLREYKRQRPSANYIPSARAGCDPAHLWPHGGEGEWRDYAIDHLREKAVFSVFKRSGEMPLYRIEKNPKLAAKQGAYCVVNTDGRILKRGHELPQVLKVFDKVLKLIE